MNMIERIEDELGGIREAGLYKDERVITSPQGAAIRVRDGREVLNFCANNYLGLANHPEMIAAAKRALDDHGFGMASVRFICGTQDLHKELEAKGIAIDRTAIKLERPLKRSGKTEVEIKLHPEITATLTVTVEAQEKEKPGESTPAEPAADA